MKALHVSFMDRHLVSADECNHYQVQTLQLPICDGCCLAIHPTPAAAWQ